MHSNKFISDKITIPQINTGTAQHFSYYSLSLIKKTKQKQVRWAFIIFTIFSMKKASEVVTTAHPLSHHLTQLTNNYAGSSRLIVECMECLVSIVSLCTKYISGLAWQKLAIRV